MSDVITTLAQAIVSLISSTGYLGIILLMAIESACIPLPSEIIMPFAGYLTTTGRLDLVVAATAGAIGCNLGSVVAYLIGARGGRRALERWGDIVLIGPHELASAEWFFTRFGAAAVFIGRLLPVVRTFIALPAGLARMPVLRFHLYTFVGSWIWCFVLALIGARLGAQWDSNPTLREAFHRFDAAIAIALVLAVAWFVWRRLSARRGRP